MRYKLARHRVQSRPPRSLKDAESRSWALDAFGVREAWKELGTRGEGARVAVLDTGCLLTHEDLKVDGFRSTARRRDGREDPNGHGTHVCGVIKSARLGVAPDCELHVWRVFEANGGCYSQSIVDALEEIDSGRHGHFDVVNMSLGSRSRCERTSALVLKLAAKGTIVVCAAGNSADHTSPRAPRFGTVMYPARSDGTLAVGSVGKRRRRSVFSSTGPRITVMGPGKDVVSTWNDGGYRVLDGTSMAAPFVAGCIALLASSERMKQPCRSLRASSASISDTSPKPRDRQSSSFAPGRLNASAVLWALATTSSDIEDRGFDMTTGYGCVRPLAMARAYEAFLAGLCVPR